MDDIEVKARKAALQKVIDFARKEQAAGLRPQDDSVPSEDPGPQDDEQAESDVSKLRALANKE